MYLFKEFILTICIRVLGIVVGLSVDFLIELAFPPVDTFHKDWLGLNYAEHTIFLGVFTLIPSIILVNRIVKYFSERLMFRFSEPHYEETWRKFNKKQREKDPEREKLIQEMLDSDYLRSWDKHRIKKGRVKDYMLNLFLSDYLKDKAEKVDIAITN